MVLHPFLFASVPILFLYAFNIDQANFVDALIPLLISLGVTAVLLLVLQAILKNKQESGMLVSLGLVIFYSYGHVRNAVGGVSVLSKLPIWLPLYAVLFLVGVVLIVRYREKLEKATTIMTVIAAALLVMSLFNIVLGKTRGRASPPGLKSRRLNASAVGGEKNLPDIYYIIVDSFAGERSLEKYYGYDDSGLIQFLRSRGFYVGARPRSNYMETFNSLTSSLNMTHLEFLSRNPGVNSKDRSVPYAMLRKSEVARELKKVGYKFVLFVPGWGGWRSGNNADVTLTRSGNFNNEFFSELMRTTILRKFASPGLTTREEVLYTFREIPRVGAGEEGPVLVVAHLMPPHHPFLFDHDGKQTKNSNPGSKSAREKAYVEQVRFVSGKLKEMVTAIESNSGRPSAIIIQGDHGPAYVGEASTTDKMPTEDALDERTAILNAYYLPLTDGRTAKLYDTITPVNSFREVFNLYFKAGYERLPDRTYYSTYNHPYKYVDITDKLSN